MGLLDVIILWVGKYPFWTWPDCDADQWNITDHYLFSSYVQPHDVLGAWFTFSHCAKMKCFITDSFTLHHCSETPDGAPLSSVLGSQSEENLLWLVLQSAEGGTGSCKSNRNSECWHLTPTWDMWMSMRGNAAVMKSEGSYITSLCPKSYWANRIGISATYGCRYFQSPWDRRMILV